MLNSDTVGKRCKFYRMRNFVSQADVAKETGYSQCNISKFESGKNDNSLILLWYLNHGMSKKELLTGIPEDGEKYGNY